MKNIKIVTVITIVVTVAYTIGLILMSSNRMLPSETTLMILRSDWSIKLPFQVSQYWNLIWAPIVLIVAAYCYNLDEIIGREPKADDENLHNKHSAKVAVSIMTAVSFVVSVGSGTIYAMVSSFGLASAESFGPLSIAATCVVIFLGAYIGFGVCVQFMMFLFQDTFFSEQTVSDRYMSMVVHFIKIGTLKTFPFLIGTTVAYMCRLVISGIANICKSTKTVLVEA